MSIPEDALAVSSDRTRVPRQRPHRGPCESDRRTHARPGSASARMRRSTRSYRTITVLRRAGAAGRTRRCGRRRPAACSDSARRDRMRRFGARGVEPRVVLKAGADVAADGDRQRVHGSLVGAEARRSPSGVRQAACRRPRSASGRRPGAEFGKPEHEVRVQRRLDGAAGEQAVGEVRHAEAEDLKPGPDRALRRAGGPRPRSSRSR